VEAAKLRDGGGCGEEGRRIGAELFCCGL